MKESFKSKKEANSDEWTPPIPEKKGSMIAKKDFIIHFNEHHIEIKKGDDVSGVPEMFHQNLKTEEVI